MIKVQISETVSLHVTAWRFRLLILDLHMQGLLPKTQKIRLRMSNCSLRYFRYHCSGSYYPMFWEISLSLYVTKTIPVMCDYAERAVIQTLLHEARHAQQNAKFENAGAFNSEYKSAGKGQKNKFEVDAINYSNDNLGTFLLRFNSYTKPKGGHVMEREELMQMKKEEINRAIQTEFRVAGYTPSMLKRMKKEALVAEFLEIQEATFKKKGSTPTTSAKKRVKVKEIVKKMLEKGATIQQMVDEVLNKRDANGEHLTEAVELAERRRKVEVTVKTVMYDLASTKYGDGWEIKKNEKGVYKRVGYKN